MASEEYDVCVVGAGIVGSSTARFLASRGKSTLLLEQFPVLHSRGSSHGHSRCIRSVYKDPEYASMIPESFEMWMELEKLEGTKLLLRNGVLYVSSKKEETQEMAEWLKRSAVEYKLLSSEDLRKMYPSLNYGDQETAVLDTTAGTLMAVKCVEAMQNQFRKHGGSLHDDEQVKEIVPGPVVQIRTNKTTYKAKAVVITPGSWASQILRTLGLNLPLKIHRLPVCYSKIQSTGDFVAENGFPNVVGDIVFRGKRHFVSCMPEHKWYPGMIKCCPYGGVCIDPSELKDEPTVEVDEETKSLLSSYIEKHLTGVDPDPKVFEMCHCTSTPDEHFILDHHPDHRNIVIGAGFSGVCIEYLSEFFFIPF